jgi:hypothetical protein
MAAHWSSIRRCRASRRRTELQGPCHLAGRTATSRSPPAARPITIAHFRHATHSGWPDPASEGQGLMRHRCRFSTPKHPSKDINRQPCRTKPRCRLSRGSIVQPRRRLTGRRRDFLARHSFLRRSQMRAFLYLSRRHWMSFRQRGRLGAGRLEAATRALSQR